MNRLTNISFILLLFCIWSVSIAADQFVKQDILLKHKRYVLEIARTQAEKSRGLMFRQSIASDNGMLFEYSKPGHYRIWMKNTLIPLTVLWLDSEARVIEKQLLQPCKRDPCPVYGSVMNVVYIIELNSSEFNRFQPGDQLTSILQLSN